MLHSEHFLFRGVFNSLEKFQHFLINMLKNAQSFAKLIIEIIVYQQFNRFYKKRQQMFKNKRATKIKQLLKNKARCGE